MTDQKKLLGVLGLCRRAGCLIVGADPICDALRAVRRGREPRLVLISDECSENTKKRLTDKCTFYKVNYKTVPLDQTTIAKAIGMSGEVAAVAIADDGFRISVEKQLGV